MDFDRWEKSVEGKTIDGVPMNRYWLAPSDRRMGVAVPNPVMSREEISAGTRRAWNRFYGLRLLWERSRRATKLSERLAFVLVCKVVPPDVRENRAGGR